MDDAGCCGGTTCHLFYKQLSKSMGRGGTQAWCPQGAPAASELCPCDCSTMVAGAFCLQHRGKAFLRGAVEEYGDSTDRRGQS